MVEAQSSKDTGKESGLTAKAGQDRKRGLFGRAWGSSKERAGGSKQSKASKSKSKLGEPAAPMAHKTAGVPTAGCCEL